jgi:hypothetical protein
MQGYLIENAKVITGFVPLDGNAVGWTGDWVHMRDYRRCCIWIQQGAWAGGTAAVTLNQGKTNTGGSSKAIAFTQMWTWTGLTADGPTAPTAVTSNTFTLATPANTTTVMEIHVNDLDITNGFYYVNCTIATPGSNADLCACCYILYDAAHAMKAESAPVVISG